MASLIWRREEGDDGEGGGVVEGFHPLVARGGWQWGRFQVTTQMRASLIQKICEEIFEDSFLFDRNFLEDSNT